VYSGDSQIQRIRLFASWPVPLILLSLGFTAIIALYWPTVAGLAGTWVNSVTYNHGLLIIPLSLYLSWSRRSSLRTVKPSFDWRGVILLAGGSTGWLMGHVSHAKVIEEAALISMIPSLVLTFLGWETVRILAFPLVLLVFAVPMGEELVPFLQDVTALFAVKGLEWSGVPVHWEGRILTIPSGTWGVVESCSGIRYLFTSLVCGCLMADWAFLSLKKKVLFVFGSALLSIAANGVRAYGIILVAHLTNNQIAVGLDHLLYGWVFFGLIVALLAATARWFRDPEHFDTHAGQVLEITIPDQRRFCYSDIRWAVVVLVIVSAGPVWGSLLDRSPAVPSHLIMEPPAVSAPWNVDEKSRSLWTPRFQGAAAVAERSYSDGKQNVQLYLAAYAEEKNGAELVSSENRFYEPDGLGDWRVIREGVQSLMVEGGTVEAKELLLYGRNERRIIVTWYWVDGKFVSNPYRVKFLQGMSRLLGRPTTGVAIVAHTACPNRQEDGLQAIQEFLRHATFEPAFSSLQTAKLPSL